MITDDQRKRYTDALAWFAEEMKHGPCGPQCAAYMAAIEALASQLKEEIDE